MPANVRQQELFRLPNWLMDQPVPYRRDNMADDYTTVVDAKGVPYYKPLPPAKFDIPDTDKPCILSEQFADALESFQAGISEMIHTLRTKQPTDAFELDFEINCHRNGIASVSLETDNKTNTTKFTLKCYCNGGN
jgi:hypothetical protein